MFVPGTLFDLSAAAGIGCDATDVSSISLCEVRERPAADILVPVPDRNQALLFQSNRLKDVRNCRDFCSISKVSRNGDAGRLNPV